MVDEVFKWTVTVMFIGCAIGIYMLLYVWLRELWENR